MTGVPGTHGEGGAALLERETELVEIDEVLAAARDGRGEAILFEGPAGIGKTSLLGAAAERAAGAGMRVLRASGDQLEREFPWGVAIQLFGPVAIEPGTDELFEGAAGLTRPLLERGRPPSGAADAHPLLHGFHWLTSNLAERAPLALLVDDAHLADPQSLRLVHYLLRRIGGIRASLALGVRSETAPDGGAEELLKAIRADPAARARTVEPLAGHSIEALVKAQLPEAEETFCAALASAVAGNPFLCRELLGAVTEEGIEPTASGAARVSGLRPDGIRNSILVRLGRMGPAAVHLAAAVAVLGPAARTPLAAELAGLDPDAAALAADQLAAAELLEVGAGLRFVHPIVREVVYDDLAPAGRRRDHLRAARLLAARGAPPAEVASHLLRGDPAGEEWAVRALREGAAEDLARGAPATAVQLLRAALADPAAAPARAEILVELGGAEAAAGEVAAADRFREALGLAPGDRKAAAIALALGEALYVNGHFAEAADASEHGLQLLERLDAADRDPVLEARLLAALDTPGRPTGRHPERLRERTQALIAEPGANPTPADRVLMAIAASEHAIGGDLPRDRVATLARAALGGEELPEELGRVTVELAVVALVFCDRFREASAILDRLVERARERGEASSYVNLLTLQALSACATGPLPIAAAEAEDAIRIAAETPGPDRPALAAARYALVSAALQRGEIAEAEAAVEVDGAAEDWADSPLYGWRLAARGEVELATGRHAEALRSFEAAGERFRSGRVEVGTFCGWRSGAALAARGCGAEERGRELAEEELRLARCFGSERAVAVALRTIGLLGTDAAESVSLLREAADAAAGSEALVERARTLVELGAALRRAGRRRECREPLREGLQEARRTGARRLAEQAASELKASGARRPQLALSGVESLTPSELRVAGMAAAGMGNREIAESLFVTRKTVEVHLSNTYRKLEISSREELPAALAAEAPSQSSR